jgi:peroxiredoxin
MVEAARTVEVGGDAHNFDIPDERGLPWSLSGQLETSPVMLVFHRGDWCPFANGQLAMLARSHDQFARRGVQVVGVSADPPPDNLEMRNKLLVPFTLLSDARGEVAARHGLWDGSEGVGVPAVVIVDRSATVRYVHAGVDVADHPPRDELLGALRALPQADKRGMSGPEVVLDASEARQRSLPQHDLDPVPLEELLPFYDGALAATRTLGERLRARRWPSRSAVRGTERYLQTLTTYREAVRETTVLAEGE